MNYLNFIKTIKNKKYNFIFYENIKPNKNKQIILRHDVDFDIDYAVNIAKIEKKLKNNFILQKVKRKQKSF